MADAQPTDFERGYEAALAAAQDVVRSHMDAVSSRSRLVIKTAEPRWRALYEAWIDLKSLPSRSR